VRLLLPFAGEPNAHHGQLRIAARCASLFLLAACHMHMAYVRASGSTWLALCIEAAAGLSMELAPPRMTTALKLTDGCFNSARRKALRDWIGSSRWNLLISSTRTSRRQGLGIVAAGAQTGIRAVAAWRRSG